MSADVLVDRVLRDIRLGRDEILPGKVRLLPILLRVIPSYVARRVAATRRITSFIRLARTRHRRTPTTSENIEELMPSPSAGLTL